MGNSLIEGQSRSDVIENQYTGDNGAGPRRKRDANYGVAPFVRPGENQSNKGKHQSEIKANLSIDDHRCRNGRSAGEDKYRGVVFRCSERARGQPDNGQNQCSIEFMVFLEFAPTRGEYIDAKEQNDAC